MDKSKFLKIKQILSSWIKNTEFENHVYVVGGCVRDMLMYKEIKDIDIAVSIPDGGLKLAQFLFDKLYINHKPVLYPTYGTAMFVVEIDGESFELEAVQTRKEKYTDPTQRNPITAFGTLEEDCLRRDLTINSLYQNISTDEIIDITGTGISDIEDKIIRTPCEPDITYDDDPLRILRCVRFASRYNWHIEEKTFESMKRNIHRLSIISKERIQTELSKMFTCDYPTIALKLLKEIGAFYMIDPVLQNVYSNVDMWNHVLRATDYAKEHYKEDATEELMLAIFLELYSHFAPTDSETYHYSKDPITNFLKSLKYSNAIIDSVKSIIKFADREAYSESIESYTLINPLSQYGTSELKIVFNKPVLRLIQNHCGAKDILKKSLILIESYYMTTDVQYEMYMFNPYKDIMNEVMTDDEFFTYKLPITGQDIMTELIIPPGPAVKEKLDQAYVIAYQEPEITKEQLLDKLK